MKSAKRRIAVFASGNGSNAENIIRYFQRPDSGAEVTLVVCNRVGAPVIDKARRLGVHVEVLTREQINDESHMMPLLLDHRVDVIVLAGFLLMLPTFIIRSFPDAVVNIHPSLLPKFGGRGMYGRHVHEAVVKARETETGITIHLVSEVCDGGEVIFQASVPVDVSDTPDDVEAKVHELESRHFAEVIDDYFFRNK